MWRLQVSSGAAVSVVAGPIRGRGTCLKCEQNGAQSRGRVEAVEGRGGRASRAWVLGRVPKCGYTQSDTTCYLPHTRIAVGGARVPVYRTLYTRPGTDACKHSRSLGLGVGREQGGVSRVTSSCSPRPPVHRAFRPRRVPAHAGFVYNEHIVLRGVKGGTSFLLTLQRPVAGGTCGPACRGWRWAKLQIVETRWSDHHSGTL